MYSFSAVPVCLLIAILRSNAQEIEAETILTDTGVNLITTDTEISGEITIPYKLVGRLAIGLKNNVKTPIPCTVDLPFQCNGTLSISADGKYYLYYQRLSELYVPVTSHSFLGYEFKFADPATGGNTGNTNAEVSPMDF
ncbi:unnamed protein product [Caenorhabditis angaria]|uniref:Uncharacterized protein n=1 Tax=Caenorhabditis angaria TaxID=860376 RepID=A0A9P1J252_9PELO|nr:unnamed protein product [Caenorhabditis angaria]